MKGVITSHTIRCIAFPIALLFLSIMASAQITVSGQVSMDTGSPLTGFALLVSGTENKVAYTDGNGNYSFELQQGGSYEISPLDCSSEPLNGVSTYDAVLISKHILGVELLPSPYKIIAADINNDGAVNLGDTTILRKLILGIIDEIPGGNFRFVRKDYVFPNPTDPFSPPFPRSFSIPNLQAAISNIDFLGIKMGDVNGTAIGTLGCSGINLPARITGKIFQDQTPDCQYSTGETPLAGWKVSASNGTSTFYGSSNNSGDYEINLLPGSYEVVLTKPNNLWSACADTVQNVVVTLANSALVDFPVLVDISCPSMDVDLSTWGLRRCFSNHYLVKYCNYGTAVAENAHVELDLDPFFVFQYSDIPGTLLSGNTYSFDLGNVPVGYCGQFSVTFTLDCDAVLGQTHCVEARIFPDTECDPAHAWSGPNLNVEGVCDGSNAVFTITNNGAAMSEPSNYIVVEDIVVMTPPVLNPFTLPSGGSQVITIPANGTTVRLEVNQAAGYPWSPMASATIEGCGTNASGSFSMGMVNLFPQNDQSPFVDVDCRQNTGSNDPNDKQGFPLGVMEEHFIPLKQPLDYLIRFQNTGTDTAFTVVIRDTLDAALDPTTIRPLGGSHPFTFNLSSEGVAQFVFTNIMLPDSSTNETASHGFVKFAIAPKAEKGVGTRIENRASIYFDFNDPVVTNTTWHTLGTKYLGSANIYAPTIGLEVFPNPSADDVQFLLKSPVGFSGTLTLFDVSGREVVSETFSQNQFTFHAKALKAGYYFFSITSGEQAIANGKLVKIE